MRRAILSHLDAFVAVVRHGSFSAAARALHRTQSSVSYQVRQLEERLGAPVFERLGRGVHPTVLGGQLFVCCERFFAELEALHAAAGSEAASAQVPLRVICGSSFGRYVLAPVMSGAAFADAIVELRFGSDAQVLSAVSEGQAELGFAYSVRPSNLLAFAPVYRERLILIAPAARFAPRRPTPQWIEQAQFVTYAESDAVYARWFEAVLATMPARLRSTVHCTEIEEAAAFVAAGRGLAVVPQHAVARELAARRLRRLREAHWPEVTNSVYAVTRAGGTPSLAAARLLASVPPE